MWCVSIISQKGICFWFYYINFRSRDCGQKVAKRSKAQKKTTHLYGNQLISCFFYSSHPNSTKESHTSLLRWTQEVDRRVCEEISGYPSLLLLLQLAEVSPNFHQYVWFTQAFPNIQIHHILINLSAISPMTDELGLVCCEMLVESIATMVGEVIIILCHHRFNCHSPSWSNLSF